MPRLAGGGPIVEWEELPSTDDTDEHRWIQAMACSYAFPGNRQQEKDDGDVIRNDRYRLMADQSPSALDPQTYAIIGCAMVVHRGLGSGFLEAVYREALHEVLSEHSVPFEAEVPLPIRFRGHVLRTTYRADLVCFADVIVELKALMRLGPQEHAQVLNYVKASGFQRAPLINFGGRRLEYRRFVGPGAPSAMPSVSSVDSVPDLPSIPAPEV
jgi:GxxExxY protein